MEHGGEEEKEGKRSAEPQLHPLMLHASASGSSSCPALRSDEEYKCWRLSSRFLDSDFLHYQRSFRSGS